MAKKRTAPDVSRDVILQAAVRLVRRLGSAGVTVGSVAAEAGCAKGLVHYHFETKQKLWEAAAVSLAQERLDRWPRAFEAGSPSEAIEQTWDLLVEESVDGTVLGWTSLLGPGSDVPGLSTSHHISRFGDALGNAIGGMLARHDVRTRVSSRELGWLLASVISGVGFLLLGGADRNELEDAYAAAWIGILSLTE